jgi:DNA repair protein RecN (Recombination protein N)
VVRVGAERAEIGAEFEVVAGSPLESLAARRRFRRRCLPAAPRDRCRVAARAPTSTARRRPSGNCARLADFLADIHGQNAHHSLLRSDAQRDLLDAHAGAQAEAKAVSAAWSAWRVAREARLAAEKDVEATARERELLDWQVKELAALAFDLDGWRETEQEQRRLGNANALLEAVGEALAALDEGESAGLPALRHAGARLTELVNCDDSLGEAAQLYESALIQFEESALALRRYQDRLDLDPQRLAELDARIDAVTQMARKHRVAPEELPALLDKLQARLAELVLRADPEALAERKKRPRPAIADGQKSSRPA